MEAPGGEVTVPRYRRLGGGLTPTVGSPAASGAAGILDRREVPGARAASPRRPGLGWRARGGPLPRVALGRTGRRPVCGGRRRRRAAARPGRRAVRRVPGPGPGRGLPDAGRRGDDVGHGRREPAARGHGGRALRPATRAPHRRPARAPCAAPGPTRRPTRTASSGSSPPASTSAVDATAADLEAAAEVATRRRGPTQLNLQLEEPLLPDSEPWWPPPHTVSARQHPAATRTEPNKTFRISAVAHQARSRRGGRRAGVELLRRGPRTVVVAGDDSGSAARILAERAGWPLLAEPTSGARVGANAVRTYRLLLGRPGLGDGIERVVVLGHPTLSRPVTRLISRDDVEVLAAPGPGGVVTDPGRVARHLGAVPTVDDAAPTAEDRELARVLAGRGPRPLGPARRARRRPPRAGRPPRRARRRGGRRPLRDPGRRLVQPGPGPRPDDHAVHPAPAPVRRGEPRPGRHRRNRLHGGRHRPRSPRTRRGRSRCSAT